MNTNILVISFIKNNILLLAIFLLLIVKVIPPEWSGFNKYIDNVNKIKANKINLLKFILDGVIDGIISPIFLHTHTMLGFKNTVTILIFFAVGFDVFVSNQISGSVVALIGIGIIALYLEKLIETGKNIKLFGGLLDWEKNG